MTAKTDAKTCYCLRNPHTWGSKENCVNAPTWHDLYRQRDTLLEAAEAALSDYEHGFEPECCGFPEHEPEQNEDWHKGYRAAIADWQNSAMRPALAAAIAQAKQDA